MGIEDGELLVVQLDLPVALVDQVVVAAVQQSALLIQIVNNYMLNWLL